MVGSAAMLCGFKRMSLAVVWFVCIASNDFNIVPPLMVSVVVSLVLARICKDRGYDEEQVLRRQVPFLEPEPPARMDRMRASELCEDLPDDAKLQPESTSHAVRLALQKQSMSDFPVIRDRGVCVGFTTRERLEAALRACAQHESEGGSASRSGRLGGASSPVADDDIKNCEEGEIECLISDGFASPMGMLPSNVALHIGRLVDPVPYTILEDMPAPRMYALFAKAGVNAACVVSDSGVFKGMITRSGLIKATREMDQG